MRGERKMSLEKRESYPCIMGAFLFVYIADRCKTRSKRQPIGKKHTDVLLLLPNTEECFDRFSFPFLLLLCCWPTGMLHAQDDVYKARQKRKCDFTWSCKCV